LTPFTTNIGPAAGGFNNATACSNIVPTANSGVQYMLNFSSKVGEFTKDIGTFTLNSLFVHADIRVSGGTVVRFLGLDGIGGTILNTKDVNILPT